MAQALETAEPQVDHVRGAESSALPDGSRLMAVQLRSGGLFCRVFPSEPGDGAAIFVGRPAFAALFSEMACRLAAQGVSSAIAQPNALVDTSAALAASSALLRNRGAKRVVLIGAMDDCAAVIERARSLDAETVLLLSPRDAPGPRTAGLLGGRPVVVCSGEDDGIARQFGPVPHSCLLRFPGASEALDEVRGDLLAGCMPLLVAALARQR